MSRYLMHHAESSSLFEVFSRAGIEHCLSEGCDDVSNLEKFEKHFSKTKEKKMETKVTFKKRVPSMAELKVADRPLHNKYRPTKLSEVIGHDSVVKSLENMLSKTTVPHSYLFTGPSGIGKTTFARILASEFKCDLVNIIEVDAATNTGIDDMRELTSTLQYSGFGKSPNKMIIIDEIQGLSKAAWGSLLKVLEDAPLHVFFALCTTDDGKVPSTVLTRCQAFNLKPLRYDDLMDLIEYVCKKENFSLAKDGDIQRLVAKSCHGSPRQALTMLANVVNCDDVNEAAALLEAPMESKEIIDLARALVSGDLDWKKAQTIIKSLSDQNPESTRIVMVNYLNACLLNTKSDRDVPRLLNLLADFSKPCNASDKWAGVLLALGNDIFPV